MPYSFPNNLPDIIKNLPVDAQKLYVKGFNSKLKISNNEEKSIKAGWGNVKTKFKKSGTNWVRKTLSVQIDGIIEKSLIPDGLPDDLLELPGQLPMVWAELFNRLVDKGVSVPEARGIAWNSVKKYVFRDDENSAWFFKKLKSEERILLEALNKTSRVEGMSKKKYQILKNGKAGNFKLLMPLNLSKSLDGDDEGSLYLKGLASANVLDRENDMMMPEFIKKMRDNAIGLPTFLDHIKKDANLIGNIVGLETDDDTVFDPITELESPEENELVKRLIKRLDKVSYGYSIGGKITKAVKVFDDEIGDYVRKIYDGEIYEVSVVPVPALAGTDVSLFKKSWDDDDDIFGEFTEKEEIEFAKSIGISDVNETVIIPGSISKSNTGWSELFWFMFEKAIDCFSESASQPAVEDLDVDSLESNCFVIKSTREYPYLYVPANKSLPTVHYGSLDLSFQKAIEDGNEDAVEKITEIRKHLGLGEKTYQFTDFRKALKATLAEAVEARETRSRMWDILSEYQTAVETVTMFSTESKEQKIADIEALTEQLVSTIDEFADIMAKDTVVMLKTLAL